MYHFQFSYFAFLSIRFTAITEIFSSFLIWFYTFTQYISFDVSSKLYKNTIPFFVNQFFIFYLETDFFLYFFRNFYILILAIHIFLICFFLFYNPTIFLFDILFTFQIFHSVFVCLLGLFVLIKWLSLTTKGRSPILVTLLEIYPWNTRALNPYLQVN